MKTAAWTSLTGILSIIFLIAPQFQSKAEETENEILTISTDSLTLSAQQDSICLTDEKFEYAALSDIAAIQIPDSISLIKSTYEKKVKLDIYDFPYSLTRNMPNWKRLWINTGTLFAGGFTAIVIMESLPDGSTNWSRAERREVPLFKRWWNHVKSGPHWDGDSWMFNFILHPYGGAAYFMTARSCGFNFWYSALYSACISTFFWEYGIEAFNEIPSIQDLFITPVIGSLLGEGFYFVKRYIVDHDYRLLGSKVVGNVVAFLVDPVNELVGYFGGNSARNKKYKFYAPENGGYPEYPGMETANDSTSTAEISLGEAERMAWEESPYLNKNGLCGAGISSHFGPAPGSAFSVSMTIKF